MNSKSTWIWLGMASALAVVIFGLERFGQPPVKTVSTLLTDFKPALVTSVQLRAVDGLEIRVERTNAAWQITSPVNYPAQAASIEGLLAVLEQIKPAAIVPPAEIRLRPDADAEFGFANPQVTLTLQSRKEFRIVQIGSRTAPADQVYVQVVGGEGVFIVDADLLRALPRKLDDWRAGSLADLSGLAFDRITVASAATVIELKRDPSQAIWHLTRPVSARANNPRLRESLQKLHAARVTHFVTDDPRADLDAYGLKTPDLELTLSQHTNAVVRLQFGRSPTNDSTQVFARRAGLDSIVTVPRDLLEPWRGSLDLFRDPQLVALPAGVAQIEVRSAEPFTLQRANGGGWRVAGQEMPVDTGAVEDFITAINRLQIAQFKDSITDPDLPAYGLATPTRQFHFSAPAAGGHAATNTFIAALAFGATNAGNISVRRADENPVYAVSLKVFQSLPAAAWQFRERRLWNFAAADVTRIVTQQGERRREFVHAGTNIWALTSGDGGPLDGARMAAIEETTHRFGELTATAWAGRGDECRARLGFNANGPALTFELKTGARFQVEFGGVSPDNYPYAIVKLDRETWCLESSLALRELVMYCLAFPAGAP
jgi:hypothetical protein